MPKLRWDDQGKAISGDAITPSDTGTHEYDALFVGDGGHIKVLLRDDTVAITFRNIGNGEFLPISVKRVYNSGTTALTILGLQTKKLG